MKNSTAMKASTALTALVAGLGVSLAQPAFADPGFHVDPWTYVGTAADCGTAGSKIVAADWVKGFGLPDATGKDNKALMLSKNGPMADCSAAGASIEGVGPTTKKGVTTPGIVLTELGYDVRNGGHCGSGAPRFNVEATDGFHFMGACNNAIVSANTPQAGWMRVRIDPSNPAHAFPPLTAGATILSIEIVFDEGVDIGPDYSGFVILDNIDINGTLIGK